MLVLGLGLVLFSCNSTKDLVDTDNEIKFVKSDKLMPALETAVGADKLIFIDFYTTWCLPCKMMEEDVFTDKAVFPYFNDKFVNLKVDAEKENGPNLALLYNVIVFPTLLFLDGDGKVLVRQEGAVSQSKLKALAEEALANHASNVGD